MDRAENNALMQDLEISGDAAGDVRGGAASPRKVADKKRRKLRSKKIFDPGPANVSGSGAVQAVKDTLNPERP